MGNIKCDICQKVGQATKQSVYNLEREHFIIYCKNCADKLRLNKWTALEQGIKIYKI